MAKRILRPQEIQKRLGVGPTMFWEKFVATGRIKLFPIGARARGALEEHVDALIEQMAQEAADAR